MGHFAAFSFRLRRCVAGALLLALALMAGAASATEQQAETPAAQAPIPVTIIDVQRILHESLAAKSVQKQLEGQRVKFQTEIAREEDELRKAEDELTTARGTLAADVYADREQQLRQRFLVVERHVQARRRALDQAFTDSMNKVRDALQSVVGTIAKERSISVVLVKQQALWSAKSLDVTDEVLSRLNKALSTVPVTVKPEEVSDQDVVFHSRKDGEILKKEDSNSLKSLSGKALGK